MIERCLMIAPCGTYLTCVHHKKQLHGFDACWDHFTVTKTFHFREKPSLDDLAENIKRSHTEEAMGDSSEVQR